MVKTLIAQFEENDRSVFWALVALLGLSVLLYLYFLSISVGAVIARKSAEQNISMLTSKISQLETTYVALDRRIDPTLARAEGFVDIATPQYITQETTRNTSLTLREVGDTR